MKLRERKKNDSIKSVPVATTEEHEEDVDDPEPADDSDCDPEWEDPAENNEDLNFSRKRKSFNPIPIQMQKNAKVVIQEKPSPKPVKSLTTKPITYITIDPKKPKNSTPSHSKDNSSVAGTSTTPVHVVKPTTTYITPNNKKDVNIVSPYSQVLKDNQSAVMTTTVKGSSKPITIIKVDPKKTYYSRTSSSMTGCSSDLMNGDFIKDLTKKDNSSIWQLDGMSLLQKFTAFKDEKTGETLYKSCYTYDGLTNMSKSKYQKVSAVIVTKTKNETIVRVNDKDTEDPLQTVIKTEPLSDTVEDIKPKVVPYVDTVIKTSVKPATDTKSTPSPQCEKDIPNPQDNQTVKYKKMFKDDIMIFLQALISQCMDTAFLSIVYSENDQYFMEKIKVVEEALEGKQCSLMSLSSFPTNSHLLYAIHSFPLIEEKQLPAVKMENFKCVVCSQVNPSEPVFSNVCLELKGMPYDWTTLRPKDEPLDIEEDMKVLLVCKSCAKILCLYSKIFHTKYLVFKQCERAVNRIKENQNTKVPSELLESLLSNEPWCETIILQMIRDWITVDDLKRETYTNK